MENNGNKKINANKKKDVNKKINVSKGNKEDKKKKGNGEHEEFIKKIGHAAIKYYNKYEILPSLTIAQAILESRWGESKLAVQCHNYFGMKWVEGCGCGYKTFRTGEQRPDGTRYMVEAKFRSYKTISEGIEGYYKFLQYPRYRNIRGVKDYKEACKLIKEDGWATSLDYTNNLISLIKEHKLYNYDKCANRKG